MAKKRGTKIYILLGRSGAGKGTQAALLSKKLGFKIIATGDLFRSLAKEKSVLGKEVKKLMDSGGLPADWIAIYLWLRELLRNPDAKGFIFDGALRRPEEAEAIDAVAPILFNALPVPILISVSEKEAVARLLHRMTCKNCKKSPYYKKGEKIPVICALCGGQMIKRSDDNPAAIRGRMRFYSDSVQKVIRYYAKRKRLVRVNGEQSVEKVFKELLLKIIYR